MQSAEEILKQLDSPDLTPDERALRRCQLAAEFIHTGQYETARDVRATAIIQFLHGLETLFLEVVYKGVALDPQRVEAVATRVDSLVAMAQQWVQMGRTEKAAIEKALAPLLDKNHAHK